MQKTERGLLFSPSDLITFMSDTFSSWMDRCYVEGSTTYAPGKADESSALVQKLGLRHEQNFLQQLKLEGKDVCEINSRGDIAFAETVAAMKVGREVIYQGYLRKDNFAGLSDFLVRANGASALGDYHYEVWDSKLAKKAKPYFLVQLCCYAEMLELLQGRLPEQIAVVLGNSETRIYKTIDYYAFYQQLKERFIKFQMDFNPNQPPEWIDVGSYSRWSSLAEELLEERDDLIRVANIRKSQIKKLKDSGIITLRELALTHSLSVAGISQNAFDALKAQALLQFDSKNLDKPLYQILTQAKDSEPSGLGMLPPESPQDLYFDMEGYPHIEGGLEYLFGAVSLGEAGGTPALPALSNDGKMDFNDGTMIFDDWWAHDRAEEKVAFEHFVDWIRLRWAKDPGMHIYHYGAYEISAMRRLASRHVTREMELDELLRAEAFVDLYSVVRQGIRLGCDSYSIKKVELLYMDKRQGEVAKATDSIVYYERWLEIRDGENWQSSAILKDIRDYNQIDCESTAKLCAWLRREQKSAGIKYRKLKTKTSAPIVRDKKPSELLAEQMLNSIPTDRSGNEEHWRVTELFAYLLGFHGREEKVFWWEFFDRADMTDDELLADPECIAFVQRTSTAPEDYKKSFLLEYCFDPSQDIKLKVGDKVAFSSDLALSNSIESLDEEYGRVKLKSTLKKGQLPLSGHLILKEQTSYEALKDAILRQASRFQSGAKLKSCIQSYLFKELARLKNLPLGADILGSISAQKLNHIHKQSANETELAIEAISRLDHSYLCVQGPPGTGKTYLAAQSIIHLLRQGKRIGVSSNSHKAIENLLAEIGRTALREGFDFSGAKIGSDGSGEPDLGNPSIKVMERNKAIKILDELQLIGATAWFFVDPALSNKLDYLFIDEAGQVCLANVIAMGEAAENLVLIGDQLQLDQPVRGSHPGQSGTSSLEYLLADSSTISPERGIFLSTTRRLHPKICSLISSAVYDGRLHTDPDSPGRTLILPPVHNLIRATSGVLFKAVEHSGNSQSSAEEVDFIKNLIAELTKCQLRFGSQQRDLTLQDIMIVAPYNSQVRLISTSIPGAKVGSVDRFQGREAAVVIISMCASDLASSPRGMEFLLSKKRLNVAITRAQVLAIIVGNPGLSQFACSTVEQAALLNLYCRIMQEGRLIVQ